MFQEENQHEQVCGGGKRGSVCEKHDVCLAGVWVNLGAQWALRMKRYAGADR